MNWKGPAPNWVKLTCECGRTRYYRKRDIERLWSDREYKCGKCVYPIAAEKGREALAAQRASATKARSAKGRLPVIGKGHI